METGTKHINFDCPRFNGMDFLRWWSKLEQYFNVEGIGDQAKVHMVMLHLEGKASDWHHFFAQRQGGLH